MSSSPLRPLFVEPLAGRVRGWLASGKLSEDDLDHALSAPAVRLAVLDHCFVDVVEGYEESVADEVCVGKCR